MSEFARLCLFRQSFAAARLLTSLFPNGIVGNTNQFSLQRGIDMTIQFFHADELRTGILAVSEELGFALCQEQTDLEVMVF